MEESIRLWDTLLCDPERFQFCNYVCVALVSFVRDQIRDGDFACCMENLQKSSESVRDIQSLLTRANEVCLKYGKHQVNYLNSDQILSTYSAYLGKHI